jgi:hypothetical protein
MDWGGISEKLTTHRFHNYVIAPSLGMRRETTRKFRLATGAFFLPRDSWAEEATLLLVTTGLDPVVHADVRLSKPIGR